MMRSRDLVVWTMPITGAITRKNIRGIRSICTNRSRSVSTTNWHTHTILISAIWICTRTMGQPGKRKQYGMKMNGVKISTCGNGTRRYTSTRRRCGAPRTMKTTSLMQRHPQPLGNMRTVCNIATATLGSPVAQEIVEFRRAKRELEGLTLGSAPILEPMWNSYQLFSPAVAADIAIDPELRAAALHYGVRPSVSVPILVGPSPGRRARAPAPGESIACWGLYPHK